MCWHIIIQANNWGRLDSQPVQPYRPDSDTLASDTHSADVRHFRHWNDNTGRSSSFWRGNGDQSYEIIDKRYREARACAWSIFDKLFTGSLKETDGEVLNEA